MAEEKARCEGPKKENEKKETIEECANMCRGVSSMFIYGTNDYGNRGCFIDGAGTGCMCLCELSSVEGKCNKVEDEKFRLYRYKTNNIGI